jgi:hypothetical protein
MSRSVGNLKQLFMGLGVAGSVSLAAAGCGGGPASDAARAHPDNGTPRSTRSTPAPPHRSGTTSSTTTSVVHGPDHTDVTSTTAPPPKPAITQTTTSVVPAPRSGFRGIYEFAGGNSAADATNANLAGVVLVYYWSQIEPQKGVFDWSVIDGAMAPWVAAGKKVILRISTSGSAAWDPPYSGSGTPAWVYADGTRTVADNGESLPVYWDPSYLADYQSFVQSFALRFDGNPNVAFIEPGIGMGGETLPDTNASSAGVATWQSDGYTNSLWLTTVERIATYFKAYFRATPVYPLVDRTFFDGDSTDINAVMAWFKQTANWGLQDDGLTSSQTLSSEWAGPPLALEERDPTQTTGDCLCADITNGLENLHGSYLLLYRSDIDAPANSGFLHQAATQGT